MGTAYFLVFIASLLAGILFIIHKSNADSRKKDDALDLQELQAAYQRNEIEHPRVEAYVDWYMRKLEDVRCDKERRKNLGIA